MPSSYSWIPGILAKIGSTVALPTDWVMPFTPNYYEDWLVR